MCTVAARRAPGHMWFREDVCASLCRRLLHTDTGCCAAAVVLPPPLCSSLSARAMCICCGVAAMGAGCVHRSRRRHASRCRRPGGARTCRWQHPRMHHCTARCQHSARCSHSGGPPESPSAAGWRRSSTSRRCRCAARGRCRVEAACRRRRAVDLVTRRSHRLRRFGSAPLACARLGLLEQSGADSSRLEQEFEQTRVATRADSSKLEPTRAGSLADRAR